MPSEPVLKVERVYNLGDYKSFRAAVFDSDLEHEERVSKMVDIIADQKEMFLIHQLLEANMYGREEDAIRWRGAIDRLNELREEIKQDLLNTDSDLEEKQLLDEMWEVTMSDNLHGGE